jgi:peptidyl-tRNA hydrolase, PTH1 family
VSGPGAIPKVVLGLGNPGEEYRLTRHNLGFLVADELARRARVSFRLAGPAGRSAWTAQVEVGGVAVLLAKPRTWMNRSGRAAAALREACGLDPGDFLVVHDDADLAFGRVRIRPTGSAGGHNGLRSVMDVLGTRDFPRVKLGVRGGGRDDSDLAEYVLGRFEDDELPHVHALVERGAEAVESVLRLGVGAAMNLFNGDPASPGGEGVQSKET